MDDLAPLIDRAALARATFGDADLAREVLGLFRAQCARLGPALADAARPAAERADLAHTLKGSAAGVGAARVGALAERLDAALRRADAGEAARLLPPLLAAIAATAETIGTAGIGATGAGAADRAPEA
ncbi:Hpt domain-containing protein [Methylobacterium sp. WSM2598]|uniref:Hpt domain-containing protein n=1 Tax=Methylobacterium sp. WSM2598 TaxID=398261 RepID=UPI000372DAF5|nr:Hpt domain-containing protein [Methylobacterium sp. WSM2598]